MIFKKTMSQYFTKDYCQGWNDAVTESERN